MRIKAITCEVLARAVYLNAATSRNVIDVVLLEQALHDLRPAARVSRLQGQIDAATAPAYEAVVLVYGLCNLALHGLEARELPIVVARAHDCITLYLGSRKRYDTEFAATPGTYYYSEDYLERLKSADEKGRRLTMGVATPIEDDYQYLVSRFGEDNAAYLMEVMGQWQKHYQRAAYIETGLGGSGAYREVAEQDAARYGWKFEQLQGDLSLIHKLLEAEWDDDFLVVQPGQRIVATNDARIISAQ